MVGICRLCASLRKDDQLYTISNANEDICQKVQKCCNVQIRIEDILPKCVCNDCVKSLEQAFTFYSRVHDAQEALTMTFLSTSVQDDNTPGRSKSITVQKFARELQPTGIPIELVNALAPQNETFVEIQPEDIKTENYYADDPTQNVSTNEESFALEQNFKEHENLLIENRWDERNQPDTEFIINGLSKREIAQTWLSSSNNEGSESMDIPAAKRSKEANISSTEEIIGILKTVLNNQKKVESRITSLEKLVEESVNDKSLKMTMIQATNKSKVPINKDSNSKIHIEIANLLPLYTIDKINDLEEKLKDKIYAEEMISYLYRLKGVHGELDVVFRRLFSDDVLYFFNWDGRWSKKALQKLRLANDFLFEIFKDDGRIQFEKDIRKCIELSHNRTKQKMYKKRNLL